jgi:DNA-binding response OmpR family regulator
VVTRAGTEISLTSRELSLLEFLMRRRGQVVTKAEILGNVWDYAFDGDPNIVEVYVGRLRRKVDRPFGRADIETLRGSGYRL